MPSGVPTQFVFVNQKAHQLGYSDCGVRVIKLDRDLFVEVFRLAASRPMHAQHILQGAGDEKELLL